MMNNNGHNIDGESGLKKDRDAPISLVKRQHRNDSIGWLVGAIIIFFVTVISAARLTLIGQFLDDVIFTFIFGWFKYLIYICLLVIGITLSTGTKINVRWRVKVMIAVLIITACWLVSAILLLVVNANNFATSNIPVWDKRIFSIVMNDYLHHWQTASIFAKSSMNLSFIYFNGQWITFFAGGGIIGSFLSAIFSYASTVGNFIICAIFLFFVLCWVIGGDWRVIFSKKYNANHLRIVRLRADKNGARSHNRSGFYHDINVDDDSAYVSRQVMHTTEQSDITIQMPSFTNIHNSDIINELTESSRRHNRRQAEQRNGYVDAPNQTIVPIVTNGIDIDELKPNQSSPSSWIEPTRIAPAAKTTSDYQREYQQSHDAYVPPKSSLKIPTKAEYIRPRRYSTDLPDYESAFGAGVSLDEARARLGRDAQLSPFSKGERSALTHVINNSVKSNESVPTENWSDSQQPVQIESESQSAVFKQSPQTVVQPEPTHQNLNRVTFTQEQTQVTSSGKRKPSATVSVSVNNENEHVSPFGQSYQKQSPPEPKEQPISIKQVESNQRVSTPAQPSTQQPVAKPAPINKINRSYKLPSLELLNPKQVNTANNEINERSAKTKAGSIDNIFATFGVGAKVIGAVIGPTVTKFEIGLDPGVKVNKIIGLENDLKMALATANVRLEAPIQGKSAVGLEVANERSNKVPIRDLMERIPGQYKDNKLTVALGETVTGDILFAELNKMPHLLIAGSTGSGKSVCINTIIASLILRTRPHELRLMLIDPKQVELAVYNDLPHLIAPVISDTKQANNALKKIIVEMDRRYSLMTENGVRNIEGYNAKAKKDEEKLPYIVVIIDELADLMITTGREVEESIMRITQLARAAGIHLILATQRPSTNIITGVIKNNVPSRIAFYVASGHDSRTILDHVGADRLIGQGDMLYAPAGQNTPLRAQGAFISDDEIERLVEYVKSQQEVKYDSDFLNLEKDYSQNTMSSGEVDEMYDEVKRFVILSQKASTSLIQRKFSLGYNRASRIIEAMEEDGIIGPQNGVKPREVFIKPDGNGM